MGGSPRSTTRVGTTRRLSLRDQRPNRADTDRRWLPISCETVPSRVTRPNEETQATCCSVLEVWPGGCLKRGRHQVQRGQLLTAHGLDVRQGVGGSDPPEVERVIHDRREEVDGLDESQVRRQLENGRSSAAGGCSHSRRRETVRCDSDRR